MVMLSYFSKGHPGITVIEKEFRVGQVVVLGELFQDGPLILDAAGDTLLLIVTGQSGV